MDWNAIKAEYITDADSSIRKLAEKYGLSRNTLGHRAKQESWSDLKRQYKDNIVTKTVKNLETKEISRAIRLCAVSDKLLARIERIADSDGELPPATIDLLASSLKKIKDVQMVKSDIDIREQEARIKALERQNENAQETPHVVVTFGEGERYAK